MNDRLDLTPVALYARVSSDRQDVDLSIAAQLRALRDYAEKNDYLVAREYVDEAESGRIADRPQFQKMLNEANKPEAPFKEILVWKFSRFTRKREHAVAFKSMLRRRGVRVVSITEQADDTPTGKLLEAIIESVDEFYSENLAQEVTRGMREAASRGFWMTTYAPYGYKRVHVQDGAAKRPKLELNPPADAVVRRVFDMVLQGKSILDVTKTLNAEGIPTTNGKKWLKTTIHTMLSHEAYTGTLVWGANAKDGAPPVRVEDAHPAIISKRDFQKARRLRGSRAPKKVNPRRASSPYLLSGIAKCETCGKAMTAAEAKSGKYTYYICHSLLKRGKGACETPRLNAKKFERIIVDELRANILTESNIRDLVKLLDEEMDGVAAEQRHMLESIDGELEEVKKRLGRVWHFIARSDSVDVAEASDLIVELRERKEKLEIATEEARALLKERRQFLDSADTIAAFAAEMSEFLKTSELTETKAFVGSFVKEVVVKPGRAAIVYSIPTPDDSPMGGADAAEIALNGRVMNSVRHGGVDRFRPDAPGQRGLNMWWAHHNFLVWPWACCLAAACEACVLDPRLLMMDLPSRIIPSCIVNTRLQASLTRGVMGYQNHRLPPLRVVLAQQFQQLPGVLRVQVASGLVSQQEIRPCDQRPSDGHSLLLPGRQFHRTVARPVPHSHRLQRLCGGSPRRLSALARVLGWERHIFHGRQRRN